MIELYNGDCRAFLSNYNGERFDAVITDTTYASGGATLSERSASTSQKYTATKKACPFPDFMGDQMDSRSWLHMMADILALARVQCHDGAVLVVFCDWRQIPLLTDAVQWAGWQWRGTRGWDLLTSRPQIGRYRYIIERNMGFLQSLKQSRIGILSQRAMPYVCLAIPLIIIIIKDRYFCLISLSGQITKLFKFPANICNLLQSTVILIVII